MKKYYQTLSKEKKDKVKEIYLKEYKNSDFQTRLTRLNIYAIAGYISAIIILVYALLYENKNIGSIIISITLFIVSTVFLIGRYFVKLNVLNKIALKNK